MKFCPYCGSRIVTGGALFCSECGMSLSPEANQSQTPEATHISREVPIHATEFRPQPSQRIWNRLNDWLNSVGLWLEARVSKLFRKPLTRTRLRVWFSVSAGIAFYFLLLTLVVIQLGDQAQILGVQVVPVIQMPFLLLVLAFLIYLIVLPPNWLKVLQLLMWACLVRGLVFLVWNLLVLVQGITYASSGVELLLLIVVFLVYSPLAGFLIVLPATYVWVRTRNPSALAQ